MPHYTKTFSLLKKTFAFNVFHIKMNAELFLDYKPEFRMNGRMHNHIFEMYILYAHSFFMCNRCLTLRDTLT